MADAPAVNDVPAVYPKHNTTSDMPDLTAPVAAPEPVLGGEGSDAPAAVVAEAPAVDGPPHKPEPAAPKRGRPSKTDREMAELRAQIAALTSAVQASVAKPPATPPPAPLPVETPKPKRADFDDPDAYDEALVSWAGERAAAKAVAETDKQRREREAEEAAAKTAKTAEDEVAAERREWETKWGALTEKYGADEVRAAVEENGDLPVSPSMEVSIRQSDVGPEIAWFLFNNPDEAARIFAMPNPVKQALAIGKLEARIEAALAAAPAKPAEPAAPTQPTLAAMTQPRAAQPQPRPIRPVTPRSSPVAEPAAPENSEARIAARVAELRRENKSDLASAWGIRPQGSA